MITSLQEFKAITSCGFLKDTKFKIIHMETQLKTPETQVTWAPTSSCIDGVYTDRSGDNFLILAGGVADVEHVTVITRNGAMSDHPVEVVKPNSTGVRFFKLPKGTSMSFIND